MRFSSVSSCFQLDSEKKKKAEQATTKTGYRLAIRRAKAGKEVLNCICDYRVKYSRKIAQFKDQTSHLKR